MLLPYEKKQPTFADSKEKGIKWRTRFYNFLNPQDMNQFLNDVQEVVNNPLRHRIVEFEYDTQVDGTPFTLLRYRDDTKVDKPKERDYSLFAKLFTTKEFDDLDAILDSYDKTSLYLLAEKHLTMKTGDFFILLIWATVDRPLKFTEGLDGLRKLFSIALCK